MFLLPLVRLLSVTQIPPLLDFAIILALLLLKDPIPIIFVQLVILIVLWEGIARHPVFIILEFNPFTYLFLSK